MNKRSLMLAFLLLSFIALSTFGAITGKISGTIVDKESGDPLADVAVMVQVKDAAGNVSYSGGSYTDDDGYFSMIGVPVGKQTVIARKQGYTTLTIQGVRVIPDLNTPVNISLASEAVEGEEVTVTAERPLIRKDITSSTEIITTDEIENLAVSTVNNVIAMQGNSTENSTAMVGSSAQDGKGSNADSDSGGLHVRGGRNNEVLFMVDGVATQNPIQGGNATSINTSAIKELIVIGGGFPAEYGNAMSGVVKIITKEGADKFEGNIKVTTDAIFGIPDEDKATPTLEWDSTAINPYDGSEGYYVPTGDYDPDYEPNDLAFGYNVVEGSISGPIVPGMASFFLSGEYKMLGDRQPHYEGYNPHKSEDSYKVQGKLVFNISQDMDLSLGGYYSFRESERYEHKYKYNLANYLADEVDDYQGKVKFTHRVSEKFYYTTNLVMFHFGAKRGVKDFWDDCVYFGETDLAAGNIQYTHHGASKQMVEDNPGQLDKTFFIMDGQYPLWRDYYSDYMGAKVDMEWDAHKYHNIKTGFELKSHDMDYVETYLLTAPTPFLDVWDAKPFEANGYVQDKIELEGMIINLGLRFDYMDAKAETFAEPDEVKKNAAGDYIQYVTDPVTGETIEVEPTMTTSDAKMQISPRLGISHPISEDMLLYFNYGHFFQMPEFQYMYEHNKMNIERGNTLYGNTDLKQSKTIQYELGIKKTFADIIKLEVKAYSKNFENQVGSRLIRRILNNYVLYQTEDYGYARGIEFTISKLLSNYFATKFTYNFGIVKGTSSSQRDAYYRYITESKQDARGIPNKVYALEWDRRHGINANVDFVVPDGELGYLENSGLNLTVSAASGIPYTPEDASGNQVGEPFSARMPWYFNGVDMKVNKAFRFGMIKTNFFVKVLNLFNYKNILDVYPITGRADNDGENVEFMSDAAAAGYKDRFWNDPSMYGSPRQVQVGFDLSF